MMIEYFSELRENLTDTRLSAIPVDDVKKVVFKYVSDNGYIKGAYGYHNNNGTSYRGSPTVAEVIRILDEGDFSDYQQVDISEIDAWMDDLHPEGQWREFQERIKNTWHKNHFLRDDLSSLCAGVNSFLKQKAYDARQAAKREREAQHQQEVASESNRWAGEVGQLISFTVAEAKIATYIDVPYYAGSSYPLWKIKDEQGLIYSWGDTSGKASISVGDRIEAKIKRLNEFRGIKETQIWKVKVESAIRHHKGFFD